MCVLLNTGHTSASNFTLFRINNTSMCLCLGQLLLGRFVMLWILSSMQMLSQTWQVLKTYWTHHKSQNMGVKHFPCFIFSLVVTSHSSCFVWWLLPPVSSNCSNTTCLTATATGWYPHTQSARIRVVSVRQKDAAKEWKHTLTQQNEIMNLTWYHLCKLSKICSEICVRVWVRSVSFHCPPVNPLFVAALEPSANDQHLSLPESLYQSVC